jgi:hypothetical protein
MRLFLAAALLLTALPTEAATPGAWAALDRAARMACERDITRIASKARVNDVSGRVSGIGEPRDTDRFYALLLTGRTANFPSQWLCLYDKRAKTAVAREIEKR